MSEFKLLTVFVFCGTGSSFPSGVFIDRDSAENWIRKHKVSGTLSEYPVGTGAYDWAVEKGHFKPTRPEHESPKFIGRFSSASLWHTHYEDGNTTS